MDKPTKPSNLMPRSFGGVKNNWTAGMQSSGYEDGVPAIYGGDNLNYQIDATGKELDYCEKICDFINGIPIGNTITVDSNNKLVYSNPMNWSSRDIGEIITSTIPLSSAGLHLLDGALISGSGSYSDFVTYIANLVSSTPSIFCSEADWQTSVTTYGVCGKFVYDSVNNTVRLPKITGFTEGTITPSSLGDLTEAGLPDHTHSYYQTVQTSYGWGYAGGNYFIGPSGATSGLASVSNSIYGNASTVQPQSIKVLYYIVIATSTKTDIEVDIDEIATDLNGKADVDLSNVPTSKGILTESYVNGTSWYRVYSDGWCEQGGTGIENVSISLFKTYTSTDYNVLLTLSYNENVNPNISNIDKSTGSFLFRIGADITGSGTAYWRTSGYIS